MFKIGAWAAITPLKVGEQRLLLKGEMAVLSRLHCQHIHPINNQKERQTGTSSEHHRKSPCFILAVFHTLKTFLSPCSQGQAPFWANSTHWVQGWPNEFSQLFWVPSSFLQWLHTDDGPLGCWGSCFWSWGAIVPPSHCTHQEIHQLSPLTPECLPVICLNLRRPWLC